MRRTVSMMLPRVQGCRRWPGGHISFAGFSSVRVTLEAPGRSWIRRSRDVLLDGRVTGSDHAVGRTCNARDRSTSSGRVSGRALNVRDAFR